MMSFCMVAAQGVMLPIAILVGRSADSWAVGRSSLCAFAILPIRAALYTLSDNAFWLVGGPDARWGRGQASMEL